MSGPSTVQHGLRIANQRTGQCIRSRYDTTLPIIPLDYEEHQSIVSNDLTIPDIHLYNIEYIFRVYFNRISFFFFITRASGHSARSPPLWPCNVLPVH